MSMSDDELRAAGLVCHSYDTLFHIRKTIRRVSDFHVPLRGGLELAQLGVYLLVAFIAALVWGLILVPLMRLLGVEPSLVWFLVWLLVLPAFAAANLTKPTSDGKTVTDATLSWLRHMLDDKVHVGGRPVKKPDRGEPRLHVARVWQPLPANGATPTAASPTPSRSLHTWITTALTSSRDADPADRARSHGPTGSHPPPHDRRGTPATVVLPDTP